MAASAVEQAIKSELIHYPGVKLELQGGGKHDRAIFHFGDKSRFLTIPKTPSDWRADKNMRSSLKKTLAELGVVRSHGTVGTGSRGGKGRRTVHAAARVALNRSLLIVNIPGSSPLIKRFRTDDGRSKGSWRFEIQSSPDLSAPPLITLKRVQVRPGLERQPGVTCGFSRNKADKSWSLATSRAMVPALTKMVDTISSVDVKVARESSDEVVFQLPPGVIPTSFHPKDEAPLPSKAWPEPAEEPQEREESQEVAPATQAPSAPQVGLQDKPIVLQFPKQSISVEQAIAVLNRRKQQLGSGLRFSIEEGGYLSAVHRIGK